MPLPAGGVRSVRGLLRGAALAILGTVMPFAVRLLARPTLLRRDKDHSSCMRRHAPDHEVTGLRPDCRTLHTQ